MRHDLSRDKPNVRLMLRVTQRIFDALQSETGWVNSPACSRHTMDWNA